MTLKAFRTIPKKNLPNEDNGIFTIFAENFIDQLGLPSKDRSARPLGTLVRKFPVMTHRGTNVSPCVESRLLRTTLREG